ncbi:MAG: hypothetical protein Q9191_004987 [Dirinaria sp. TL-2023a]
MPPTRERYDEDLHHGRQSSERGRHSSGRRRQQQRPAFDEELQELYGAVGEAMNFYGSFLQSFQRDVQYVKSYARPELLDHLWMGKVGASNKRPAAAGGRGGGRGDNNSGDGYREQQYGAMDEPAHTSFHEMARLLMEHAKDTIEAAAMARQTRDGENASHVYSKLKRTINELARHLKHAPMRAKDTEILMTELQMLSTFLAANGADRGAQGELGGYREQRGGQDLDEQGGGEGYQGGYDEGQGMIPIHTPLFSKTEMM